MNEVIEKQILLKEEIKMSKLTRYIDNILRNKGYKCTVFHERKEGKLNLVVIQTIKERVYVKEYKLDRNIIRDLTEIRIALKASEIISDYERYYEGVNRSCMEFVKNVEQ